MGWFCYGSLSCAVSSNNKDSMVAAALASFRCVFNVFMSDLGHIYSFSKGCCSANTAVVSTEHPCGISIVMVLRQYV